MLCASDGAVVVQALSQDIMVAFYGYSLFFMEIFLALVFCMLILKLCFVSMDFLSVVSWELPVPFFCLSDSCT